MREAATQELGTISALWQRDMLRLRKEKSRWLGVVLQPMLFWVIIGSGMTAGFSLPGGGDYLSYFYPGILVMIVLFTTIFASISVIEDRQSGFLQSVLVSPGSRCAMLAGKISAVTTLALLQSILFLVLAPAAGFPFGQIAWGWTFVVIVLSCAGLTALNLAVAWLFTSVQGYHAIMSVVMLPLWVLSGAMFPPPDGWLGALMEVNPLTYMVAGVRGALEGGNSSPGLWVCTAVLSGVMVGAWTIAARVCR